MDVEATFASKQLEYDMKNILLSLVFSTALIAPTIQAAGNAADYDQANWQKKMTTYTQMTGRSFEYTVSGYRIKLRFNNETSINWERLEAPDGTAGMKGTQEIDRQNLHPGIFLMAWTEPDGSHVVDVIDIQRMQLFANFVTTDGKRFQTHATLIELKAGN